MHLREQDVFLWTGKKHCEHKAPKILPTEGESRSMFCECTCGGGAAPSPRTPSSCFFFLRPRDCPPPPETSPPPINSQNEKNNSQNISAPIHNLDYLILLATVVLGLINMVYGFVWHESRNQATKSKKRRSLRNMFSLCVCFQRFNI